MKIAPKGLDKCFTFANGSETNENAFKLAFMQKCKTNRGGKEPTKVELDSALQNLEPGSPNKLKILSFKSAFHGRTLGALTSTGSSAIHKLDIPAFDWPKAPFPNLLYPLEDHVRENKSIENECLEKTLDIIKINKGLIAGMIVEPILAEGGDKQASSYFFQELQKMTKENKITFIVDEVQTGVVRLENGGLMNISIWLVLLIWFVGQKKCKVLVFILIVNICLLIHIEFLTLGWVQLQLQCKRKQLLRLLRRIIY